jgi:hypothetical protein
MPQNRSHVNIPPAPAVVPSLADSSVRLLSALSAIPLLLPAPRPPAAAGRRRVGNGGEGYGSPHGGYRTEMGRRQRGIN